jgi:FMN reductase
MSRTSIFVRGNFLMVSVFRPRIVGLGGTTRSDSSSSKILRLALIAASEAGAEVESFVGADLDLPMYSPDSSHRTPPAVKLTGAIRRADGIIISAPGYHGSVSGLIKNALDYVEDLRQDSAPYFEGRAVGLIACAAGWQATGTTLITLRSVVHALRGWPTPMAVAINTIGTPLGPDGSLSDPALQSQLTVLARQVVHFAQMRALHQRDTKHASAKRRCNS